VRKTPVASRAEPQKRMRESEYAASRLTAMEITTTSTVTTAVFR